MTERLRFCVFCHQVGMMVTFPSGNALRKHVKIRHPKQSTSVSMQRNKLREYRRDILLLQARLGVRKTT